MNVQFTTLTKALMINIETLSLKPNAYVTQVGFCAAVLETREYLTPPSLYNSCASGRQPNRG